MIAEHSEHHFECTRAFEYLAEPFSPRAIPFPVRFIYPSVTPLRQGGEKKEKKKRKSFLWARVRREEKFSRNLPTPHLILAHSLTYRALPRLDSPNGLNIDDKFDRFLSNHRHLSLEWRFTRSVQLETVIIRLSFVSIYPIPKYEWILSTCRAGASSISLKVHKIKKKNCFDRKKLFR